MPEVPTKEIRALIQEILSITIIQILILAVLADFQILPQVEVFVQVPAEEEDDNAYFFYFFRINGRTFAFCPKHLRCRFGIKQS
jgi:hypothetical protein